jgi:hypothetical protein
MKNNARNEKPDGKRRPTMTERKDSMAINYRDINVTADFRGTQSPPATWGEQHRYTLRPCYTIHVRYQECTRTFLFWDGVEMPQIVTHSQKELLQVFETILDEALYGNESFEDFCNALGYDSGNNVSKAAWRGCQKALAKIQDLIPSATIDDLHTLGQQIRDDGDNLEGL